MTIRFDDSLPALVSIIASQIGHGLVENGVAIRDVNGRLAFVLPNELEVEEVQRVEAKIRAALGAYARSDRLLATPKSFGAATLLQAKDALSVNVAGHTIRLVDRRLVGVDWLRSPASKAAPPPRFVFASIKGGVGRSTALSIAAAHLASKGKRVLAIDLDMEAPGLGSLLLNDGTLPEFGLIDALVEGGLAPLDEAFLADLIGPSDLTDHRGRIEVIPAFGRRSLANPGDILSKIARAYAENVKTDGTVESVLDQISDLVNRYADPQRYDVILIDARAGLHETTATAILGLGAEVFLFGLDEPQTFHGYAALLSHLARFAGFSSNASPEWLDRLSMIQGKAPLDASARELFADRCKQLFISCGLEKSAHLLGGEPRPAAEPFRDVPWDDELSDEEVLPVEMSVFRQPVAVLNDDLFRQFDPKRRRDLLSETVYRAAYGKFLERLNESFPDLHGTDNAEEV